MQLSQTWSAPFLHPAPTDSGSHHQHICTLVGTLTCGYLRKLPLCSLLLLDKVNTRSGHYAPLHMSTSATRPEFKVTQSGEARGGMKHNLSVWELWWTGEVSSSSNTRQAAVSLSLTSHGLLISRSSCSGSQMDKSSLTWLLTTLIKIFQHFQERLDIWFPSAHWDNESFRVCLISDLLLWVLQSGPL